MPRMVEVVIDSVRVSLTNQQRIVVLREQDGDRYLPIWIGPFEAEAITIALQEIEVARPQTHDLLKSVIHTLNGRLVRVEIISMKEDVYYGNLVIEVNGKQVNVDSRPSDALALAVRTRTPIVVAREVMDTAGIVPDEDLRSQKPGAFKRVENRPESEPESPLEAPAAEETPAAAGEERLSVFEDFLQNLDLDDLDQPPDEDEPDEGKPKKR